MRIVFARFHVMEHKLNSWGEWEFDESQPLNLHQVPSDISNEAAHEIYRWITERHQTLRRTCLEEFQYEWRVARSSWPGDPLARHAGYALCIREPKGDFGLEGYCERTLVPFQECQGDKGRFFRVWPGDDPESTYWESISAGRFPRYFQIVEGLQA